MDLEAPVAVTFESPTIPHAPLSCTLRYTTADPYAVHLCFPRPDRHSAPIIWSLSRQLLATGLLEAAGLGDVRLEPWGGDRTRITLRGRTGTAALSLRTPQLRAFLRQVERLVPSGTEADLVDWDRLAEQLSSAT